MPKPSLRDEPIGALLSQAIERARTLAQAEIAFYKARVTGKVTALIRPAILGVVALLIVQASLTVLLGALGVAIAAWFGPAGGLLVAGVAGLALAGLLAFLASRMIGGGAA